MNRSPARIRTVAAAAGFALALAAGAIARQADAPRDPSSLFASDCASCHHGDDPRAPSAETLRGRSPQAILDALTSGSMRYQGLSLSGAERRAMAEFLTGRTLRGSLTGAATGRCARPPTLGDPAGAPHWNGWGPTAPNTHFQPAVQAGLAASQVPLLKLKWAFGFPDATSSWAQPSVVGGRLFVGSQNGTVYSLDAASGCIVWTFSAHGGVRASVTIGSLRKRRSPGRGPTEAAYVADQQGYVYALDASNGRELWSRRVDDHPLVRLTGSPTLFAGRLYVPTSSYEEGGKPPGYRCCTFRGSVVALDAATGKQLWKSYTIQDRPTLLRAYADGSEAWGPSGGGIWSSPTIDAKRGAVYVAAGNSYSGPPQTTTDAVLAFDLKTGALRWAHQLTPMDLFGCVPGEINCVDRPGPDFDFGAPPVLAALPDGRDLIIIGQKSGLAYALDPDRNGEPVWRYRASSGSGLGGIQWGIAVDGALAYFPVSDIYSAAPGGLHAVKLATGTRAWYAPPPPPVCGKPSRACSGAQFSAVSVIPGIVFSPSNDGALRAYSTTDGAIVWTFETNREFSTVNGVRARGGSMYGPAPAVAGGMVYVGSGYGTFGLRPGNVLLAFGIE